MEMRKSYLYILVLEYIRGDGKSTSKSQKINMMVCPIGKPERHAHKQGKYHGETEEKVNFNLLKRFSNTVCLGTLFSGNSHSFSGLHYQRNLSHKELNNWFHCWVTL
jgi:hypothetical protein